MGIYAAISVSENAALDEAVRREFGDSFYKVAPGQYLISAKKTTTKEIADRLKTQGGEVGKVLLMRVLNYKGWHSRDLWEWLSLQGPTLPEVGLDPSEPDE